MNHDFAGVPIADIAALPARRAGLVKGVAAESSERSAKPTLDEAEHRVHFLVSAMGTCPDAFFSSSQLTEPSQPRVNKTGGTPHAHGRTLTP
jgi:hypothetical protein